MKDNARIYKRARQNTDVSKTIKMFFLSTITLHNKLL